jgi:hypothetical protein
MLKERVASRRSLVGDPLGESVRLSGLRWFRNMPGVKHQNSGPATNAMGVIDTFSPGAPISARGLFFFAILALTCISLSPFPDLGDARLLELGDGNETVTYVLFFVFAVIATMIAWRSDWPALKSLFIPSYTRLTPEPENPLG